MNISSVNHHLLISSGDKVIQFDTINGNDKCVELAALELTSNTTKGQLEALNKEQPTINSLAVSRDQQYLAVTTENKQVVICNNHLTVVKSFITARTASKVVFSSSGDLIVADKTGDVFLYRFKDNENKPVLLLGHMSMILDVIITQCGKYIITCDRDEKIRVSHFPNTYDIQSYCLGHKEFVMCLKLIDNRVLVSASGDGTVRFWDYLKGEQLGIINTNENIANCDLVCASAKSMDIEALPILQMGIVEASNMLIIAVGLYGFNGILLYNSNSSNCNFTFLQCITIPENNFNFFLSDSLYVICAQGILLYQCKNGKYVSVNCNKMQLFYDKYKHIFKYPDKNAVLVLYKRKYDNVQEYLERKKLRLEK